MKKFFAFVCAVVMAVSLVSCTKEEKKEVAPGYDTYEALVDDFMLVCQEGNVDLLFSMYYDDYLDRALNLSNTGMTLEEFKPLLKDEMMQIFDKEIYEYGSSDLPANSGPLEYVNHMFSKNTGELTGLKDEQVTNMVVLRVFRDTGYRDHAVVKIDGTWYIVV